MQAIDQLEDEGGIEDVNSRLAIDEDLREVSDTCVSDLSDVIAQIDFNFRR